MGIEKVRSKKTSNGHGIHGKIKSKKILATEAHGNTRKNKFKKVKK